MTEFLSSESMVGVEAIVTLHAEELEVATGLAVAARAGEDEAKAAVDQAKEEVKHAKAALVAAEKKVPGTDSARYHAEHGLETTAKNVAREFAASESLDPLTRTLYTNVYADKSYSWRSATEDYQTAAKRGAAALGVLVERLTPGAPILFLDNNRVIVDAATEASLAVTPPSFGYEREGYSDPNWLNAGSINLAMQQATTATVTEHDLVKIETINHDFPLLTDYFEYDVDRLDRIVNSAALAIGDDEVVERVAKLLPETRFAAAVALRGAGFELPVEVDAATIEDVRAKLVQMVAYQAAGGEPIFIYDSVLRHDARTGGRRRRTEVTALAPVTEMSRDTDLQSLRLMAETIGLSRDELEDAAYGKLTDSGTSTPSLAEAGRRNKGLEALEKLLDDVFNSVLPAEVVSQ